LSVGTDAVVDVRDHPAPNRIAVARLDAGVANRPIVAAFDHRHAEPIARLRIDPPFGEPARDDAAGRAAAKDDDVVVVVAGARSGRARGGWSRRVQRDEVALEPRVGILLRELAILL